MSFSGSYAAADVTFLLKPVGEDAYGAPGIEEKERLIQTGRRHYSEMIAPEPVPSAAHMAVFEAALARHGARMAHETARLAVTLAGHVAGPVTLLSLVRAGVPLGVLLGRALGALGRDVAHFGISIIRDRGLDRVALARVLAGRPAGGVVFVDGWTGKGAIAGELARDLPMAAPGLPPRLVALADPCGRAWLSAGFEDWLIPSGLLGGNVSGLVSRSVLNPDLVGPGDFHATVRSTHLAGLDVSRRFVDTVWMAMAPALAGAEPLPDMSAERARVRAGAAAAIDRIALRFGVSNRNRIKPGIAEATRAVLRRAPDRVLVSDAEDPDLAGILGLAAERGVATEIDPGLVAPYRAVTVIRAMTGATGPGGGC